MDLGNALLACATGVVRPQLPPGPQSLQESQPVTAVTPTVIVASFLLIFMIFPYAALRVEPPSFGSDVPLTRSSGNRGWSVIARPCATTVSLPGDG